MNSTWLQSPKLNFFLTTPAFHKLKQVNVTLILTAPIHQNVFNINKRMKTKEDVILKQTTRSANNGIRDSCRVQSYFQGALKI